MALHCWLENLIVAMWLRYGTMRKKGERDRRTEGGREREKHTGYISGERMGVCRGQRHSYIHITCVICTNHTVPRGISINSMMQYICKIKLKIIHFRHPSHNIIIELSYTKLIIQMHHKRLTSQLCQRLQCGYEGTPRQKLLFIQQL